MKSNSCILGILVFGVAAFAQNEPIPTQLLSFNASPVSLPGKTLVGTDAGVSFSPTQNLDLAEHNILSSDNRMRAFLAGVKIHYEN